jgi:hypothetical protein
MKVCDQCHTEFDEALEECPACAGQQASADIEHELAHANLLRLRRQFDEAEAECVAILRRRPDSAETHALLGEIAYDQSHFEEAARWFGLSLELDPNSPSVKQRLDSAQDRITSRDSQETVRQLGLTQPQRPVWPYAAGLIGIIVLVAICAYAFGHRASGQTQQDVIRDTIQAPEDSVPGPSPATQTTTPEKLPVVDESPREDSETTQRLAVGDLAQRMMSARQDPRTKQLVMTIRITAGEVERRLAAITAKQALATISDASVATIREVRDGRIVYVADVLRTRMNEVESPTYSQANGPDAWIDYVVTNEWPVAATADSAGAVPGTTG